MKLRFLLTLVVAGSLHAGACARADELRWTAQQDDKISLDQELALAEIPEATICLERRRTQQRFTRGWLHPPEMYDALPPSFHSLIIP